MRYGRFKEKNSKEKRARARARVFVRETVKCNVLVLVSAAYYVGSIALEFLGRLSGSARKHRRFSHNPEGCGDRP